MKIRTIVIATFGLLASSAAFGQEDLANLERARFALDASHNCEEANKQLNLVSPDYRQTADYLLCMARTQDCMKNSEQALYYYGKVLALQPANDSVRKRTAELKDAKNKAERGGTEEKKAGEMYHTAKHTPGNKRKRKPRLNLIDDYGSYGISYGVGMSATKSPYKSVLGFNGDYGFIVAKDKAVFDWDFGTGFLLKSNSAWFASTIQLPYGTVGNVGADIGWTAAVKAGFSPILVNKKHISFAAGLFVGGEYYGFGMMDGYSNTDIRSTISFCYGPKANLYLGEHFMLFSNLVLHAPSKAHVSSSLGEFTVPTNYNTFNVGIALKTDSWW